MTTKLFLTTTLAVALIFTSCQQDVEIPGEIFKKVYTVENIPTETFSISNDRDTTLVGKSGTVIRIYKNTFVDTNGQPVNGAVDIELKEVLTPYDMVIGNLTTLSDGRMLQTGGMIYINATAAGQQVEIAGDKFIGAAVPTTEMQDSMQLFEGIADSTGVNWINPKELLNDKIKESPAVFQGDSVATVANGNGNGKIKAIFNFIASDTVDENRQNKNEGDGITNEIDESYFVDEIANPKGNNFYQTDFRTSYIFTVKKLGWANIDRLYDDLRTKEVDLVTQIENHGEFKTVYVTMLINKMYIPGYQKVDETYAFTHFDSEKARLPIGQSATILATAYKNNVPYFAIKKITITQKQNVSFKLIETTMEKLKTELKKI